METIFTTLMIFAVELRPACSIKLAPVVQTLDSAFLWINHYPLDNSIGFASVYPLDSNLSGGQRYPSFEQLGPGLLICCKVVKGTKIKITAKFRASRRLRFENTKRIDHIRILSIGLELACNGG